MADLAKRLEALDQARERFEAADAARDHAHEDLVQAALDALRDGAEPGDVYKRVPFTSTWLRTLAREAGIPAGRPGIKTKPKRMRIPKNRPTGQAAHDDTSSPT